VSGMVSGCRVCGDTPIETGRHSSLNRQRFNFIAPPPGRGEGPELALATVHASWGHAVLAGPPAAARALCCTRPSFPPRGALGACGELLGGLDAAVVAG
jgi:hypothetical protein